MRGSRGSDRSELGAVVLNSETVTCGSGGSSVRGGCPAPWGLRTAAAEGGVLEAAEDPRYEETGSFRVSILVLRLVAWWILSEGRLPGGCSVTGQGRVVVFLSSV